LPGWLSGSKVTFQPPVQCTGQAFRTQPKNMTVRAGTMVMLRCEMLRPSGAVQWVKDDLLLGPQQSLPGFPHYSLLGDPKIGESPGRVGVRVRVRVVVDVPPSKPYFEFMFLSSSDNGRKLACRTKNPVLPRALETSLVMNVYFPPQHPVIQGLDREGPVKRGTMLKLVCVSQGGNPLATLHWTKNGEVISTSWEVDTESRRAISHLTLQVKPQDNQAELHCESVNQVTPVPLSDNLKITVLCESPTAKRYMHLNARTHTQTQNNPPVHIRWWLGFRELNTTVVNVEEVGTTGGRQPCLTHVVSREENGLPLTCETFNNGTHFSKSQSNNLIVFYPPQKVWLEAPPPGVPLSSGTIIRLICFSSGGSPKGTLNWYRDGKVLLDYPKQVPSDKGMSKELVVRLQPSDNMATYRCNATNKAKIVLNASVKLIVQFPAVSVTIIAKQKELRRGQNLSLHCLSGSSNPQANISWSLGPTRLTKCFPLTSHQAHRNTTFGDVSVSSTLSLPLSSQHHGQRITCQAYSSLLSEGVNTFFKLNTFFNPDHPQKIQVVEDEIAILPLPTSPAVEMHPRYHFTGSTEFEIWNVTRRDTGVYTVNCTNDVGSDNTIITLDVQYAPSVKMENDPVYVHVGETADLFCVADANPIINTDMFSWKWLGKGEMEEMGEQIQDDATGQLTIQGATRVNAGRYQCTANNNIAPPASVAVQLVVRFKPELQKGAQWNKVASRGDSTRTAEGVCQGEGIPPLHFSWASPACPIAILCVCVSLLWGDQPDPPSEIHLVSFTHASATLEWIPGFDGGLEQRFHIR
uniref:NPHS1 adhesion molecule, nephrin n=1 Tax=Oncorhynchus kisutch TaxID=8019 RepID=A0A8C7CJ41_ONCKI